MFSLQVSRDVTGAEPPSTGTVSGEPPQEAAQPEEQQQEQGAEEEVAPTPPPGPAQIEVIGHDANTYHKPLEREGTKPENVAPVSAAIPFPLNTPVKPGTPDTKKAYEALAAIETLHTQLVYVK